MRHSMLLFLAIIGIACAGGNHSAAVTVAAAADDLQTQSPTHRSEFYRGRRRGSDGPSRSCAVTRAHSTNAILVCIHFRRASRRRCRSSHS